VPEEGIARIREQYLACHENSRYLVDFSDFSFFGLQPVDLYYVGGFGVMGWVEAGTTSLPHRTRWPTPRRASSLT
jgi:heme iron utilization protein